MMISFVKYQGTGNDFIMIDNRDNTISLDANHIGALCDRKKGIGADGVILIQEHPELDFEMVYYNSDGSQSMCGNGSRCAVQYANVLGMINGTRTNFLSTNGPHEASLDEGIIHLHLTDVKETKDFGNDELFIDTGSPHHIKFIDNAAACNVFDQGKEIRNKEIYAPGGTNVNFVEILDESSIFVRTYERGVEDETLSCGTGVTAASIAASTKNLKSPIQIKTLGGDLKVSFDMNEKGHFTNVYLIGPAEKVFEGSIDL